MQELVIYLLKSAGLMSLFFAGYYFLLKNDTDFKTNRIFLLAGIFTSILLPFLEITRTIEMEATAAPVFFENFSAAAASTPAIPSNPVDWWQIAGILYFIGLSFFLLKFFVELFSLLKLIYTHKTIKKGKFYTIQKCGNTQPFSFFKYIVFDPDRHSPEELELILKHELSHARQWHSVDQILTSLSVSLLWFNPLAWLYRKSVVQNLEYLADKEVIATEVSKMEYQKTLLKISVGNFQPALTNQFYQSFIKKRIMMLNKNTPQKSNFWKTSFMLPFLFLFIFSFNVKTEAQEVPSQDQIQVSEMEVSAFVTKNSEEKTLRSYERIFKKQGVDLRFDELKYSEGLIINVAVSFRKESTGQTGNLTLNNPEGISPLLIHTNGKEVTITPEASAPENTGGALMGIGNSPIYIIAGKEYSTSQLEGKYVETKGPWNVLQPKEAVEKYGSKAKDGAIVISGSNIIDDFKEALKSMDLKQMSFSQNYIQVRKDASPILVGVKTQITQKSTSTPSKFELTDAEFISDPNDIIAVQMGNGNSQQFYLQDSRPLVVVDGVVKKKDFDVSGIDPSTIKSLNVLKGDNAVENYGKQGENGVIEIVLKSEEEMKNSRDSTGETKESHQGTGKIHFSAHSVRFEEDGDKKGTGMTVRDVGSADPDASKPLFVIDGKEMPKDFDVNSISVDNIESITVLKDAKAVEKYGEQASKGVIEIVLKK